MSAPLRFEFLPTKKSSSPPVADGLLSTPIPSKIEGKQEKKRRKTFTFSMCLFQKDVFFFCTAQPFSKEKGLLFSLVRSPTKENSIRHLVIVLGCLQLFCLRFWYFEDPTQRNLISAPNLTFLKQSNNKVVKTQKWPRLRSAPSSRPSPPPS